MASSGDVLAVVPARGGSKGIPHKNIVVVGGMSLLARTAAVARACADIGPVLLSSDDDAIMDEGRRAGLDVLFRRPAELSGDTAKSIDVWRHAWLAAEEHHARRFELSVLLEPTSPMRRPEDIARAVAAARAPGNEAAATVSPTPAHYTPHKTLTIGDDGHLGFFAEGGAGHALRQSIPPLFHRNGACYAARRAAVVKRGLIVEDRCAAVVIERPMVNIDEPFEVELAEWLLAREAHGETVSA